MVPGLLSGYTAAPGGSAYGGQVSTDARARALDKVARLAEQPRDVVSLWRAATEVLADVVPHWWTPCWFTVDPASLLVTSHVHEGMDHMPQEWLVDEYSSTDVNQIADVARSATGVSTLHEATDGNPPASPRWHFNMTMGGDQEMIARLRTRSGEVWGAVGLYREPDRPLFDEADRRFLQDVGPHLAEGARRALLLGEATDPDHPDAPGLVVVDERWEVRSASPGVAQWLDRLPGGDPGRGRLPPSVLAVAARAAANGGHDGHGGHRGHDGNDPGAVARVRTRTGGWVVLHGTSLTADDGPRVAVIVEPASHDRVSPLLMSAYGLTEREKEVTGLVLRGLSTAEIAERLVLSPYTVQQHLKSIFDKTGVRSRRELVGRVFFAHYEPRFRDNEDRVLAGRPIRGGPHPGGT